MEVRDSGNMVLEVVADDTYFRPWESGFVVDAHTKLEVQINEQKLPAKPTISVAVNTKKDIIKEDKPKPKKFTISEAVDEMSNILKKSGINKKNLTKNKKKMSLYILLLIAKFCYQCNLQKLPVNLIYCDIS